MENGKIVFISVYNKYRKNSLTLQSQNNEKE